VPGAQAAASESEDMMERPDQLELQLELELECINLTSWRYRYPANFGHDHCYSMTASAAIQDGH